MKQPPVTIDSELGKRISLTHELFADAFGWDCRPAYLAFVRLKPKPGMEKEALTELFARLARGRSEVRIVAPLPVVEEYALKCGYEKETEACGTPYLTDRVAKQATLSQYQG